MAVLMAHWGLMLTPLGQPGASTMFQQYLGPREIIGSMLELCTVSPRCFLKYPCAASTATLQSRCAALRAQQGMRCSYKHLQLKRRLADATRNSRLEYCFGTVIRIKISGIRTHMSSLGSAFGILARSRLRSRSRSCVGPDRIETKSSSESKNV